MLPDRSRQTHHLGTVLSFILHPSRCPFWGVYFVTPSPQGGPGVLPVGFQRVLVQVFLFICLVSHGFDLLHRPFEPPPPSFGRSQRRLQPAIAEWRCFILTETRTIQTEREREQRDPYSLSLSPLLLCPRPRDPRVTVSPPS